MSETAVYLMTVIAGATFGVSLSGLFVIACRIAGVVIVGMFR